ncbi:S-adenosyl-L-methionine-dependent methyltransferase [Roridomyces roridus]|uniref:S-adenosyl-L-methionine-dependent methyltransferase n=1 Tax=Roridomyces roridus TaxID=1738132 RepID=A0AAD7C867_9AGAR|nr:S-adenosyl-L-methionine-dependent methyltransferase [Roridomyces roridus]
MSKPEYAKFTAEDKAKMEVITGVPAKAMLEQAGLLPTPPQDAVVLDNACGGGLVASLLFDVVGERRDVRVVCSDLEELMVKSAAQRIEKNEWNAEAKVADAQALPFADNHFTHVMMNFAIQLIRDKDAVFKESLRVLKQGGTFGFTVWTEPGWLESMKAGVPGYVPPPIFLPGPITSPESIKTMLTSAGFTAINVEPMTFEHTDDMTQFLADMKKLFNNVLAGEKGEAYEKYMRGRHGEGEFSLTRKACIVTAKK